MSPDTRIAHGIQFLQSRGFTHHAPADNAVILDALTDIGILEAAPVVSRVASALADQMSLPWLKSAPLEDVCRVATALHYYDETCVTGHHLAVIVRRLLANEAAPGGPYYNDAGILDVRTNAAVAVLVQWAADTLRGVTEYIEEHLTDTDDSWAVHRDLLRCSAVKCTDLQPPHQIEKVLHDQQTDGSWEIPGQSSSREVATAIMIHLWARHTKPNTPNDLHGSINALIFSQVQSLFDTHGLIIAEQARDMLQRIRKANTNYEITLLSTFFGQSLPSKEIPGPLLQQLGAANLLCWVAYSAYDHIMDGEADATLLPFANIAQRASLKMYTEACLDEQMACYVEHLFDRMEKANAWELSCTRIDAHNDQLKDITLPTYTDLGQLAERSLGHIIGPLILAHRYLGSLAVEEMEHALVRYLVARQLNDDIHDWREDTEAGILTYVVCCLLCSLPHTTTLAQAMPAMQQRFWDQTGQSISATIVDYIAQCRQILESNHLQASPGLQVLLDNIADSARRALILRQDSGNFLQHYTE
jgi:hypothetical protein